MELLDNSEKEQLIRRILTLIAQWQPIPQELLNPLPIETLRKLEQIIREIRRQGAAGGPMKTPLRLKIMRSMLENRGVPQEDQSRLTEDEILNQQPLEMQSQVRAQEALGQKETQAREALILEKSLSR